MPAEDVLDLATDDSLETLDTEQPDEQQTARETPGSTEQGEQEGESEQQQTVTSLFEADGKKIAKPIREALGKLKTDNPSVGKLVADAVYRAAEFRREFPGGLTEARQMRNDIEELGGMSEIREKIDGAEELNQLAVAFADSDPAFVEDMVASSPEAFAKLAPIVFDRYSEIDQDGFAAYIGRIVYADIREKAVDLNLSLLMNLVKDKPEALELVNNINGYLGRFKELAQKSPTAPAAKPRNTTPSSADQRENELRAREWNADRRDLQSRIRNDAYKSALAGRTPNTEEKAQIAELFNSRAVKLADRLFKDWQKVSQRYIQRNDKAGYLRYMTSIYRRVVPEAMTSAVASTLKRQGATGVTRPGEKRPPASGQTTPAEGFALVASEPATYDVDYGRTTQAMIRANQAILKNGKKVTWR